MWVPVKTREHIVFSRPRVTVNGEVPYCGILENLSPTSPVL